MAYLKADYERNQQLDFVVGFEVVLSNNHKTPDICDNLQGKYPKEFIFTGWHDSCHCHIISIMMTDEEFNQTEKMLLNGEDISGFKSVNEVTDVPEGFSKWIKDNEEMSKTWVSQPQFIKDNFRGGKIQRGLKMKRGKKRG